MKQLKGLFPAALAGYRSKGLITGLMAVAVMMLVSGTALQATGLTELKVGDVVVAVPGGKAEIIDPTITTGNPVVATLTVGSGKVGGCAFDSTYRLRCVDFGGATVVKFALKDPYGVTHTLSVTPANPQSILYSGAANDFIVGFAGGTVQTYAYNGDIVGSGCTGLPVDSSTVFWTDISSDGSTIFYTSGLGKGNKAAIRTLDLLTCKESTLFSSSNKTLPAGQGFFGLRLLTGDASASGEFLVANGDGVMLVDSAGNEVYSANAGETSNEWRSVWLDPDGTSFWSVNLADGNLYKFGIANGAREAGPYDTGASASDDTGGIAVEGGNSAAQPAVQMATLTLIPNSNDFGSGTACFYDNPAVPCTPTSPPPANANQVTVSLDNLSGPNTVTVRFSEIDPIAGTSDTNLPCLIESNDGGMCTVWEIESSGEAFTNNDLLFSSPQTPPPGVDPVLLENEATNFTTLQGGDIFVQGGSDDGFSVFSQNELPAGTDVSSGWENPITTTAGNAFNYGANIKFQFYLTNSSGIVPTSSFNCSSTTSGNCPELSLSLLRADGAPELIRPPSGTSSGGGNEGNSGTADLIFRPIGSTEWGVNLNTSTLPQPGCYVATGIDPLDRFVPFSYSTATKPSTTILAVGESTDYCRDLAKQMGLL